MQHDWSTPFSRDNEVLMLTHLCRHLESLYACIEGTDFTARIAELGDIDTLTKFNMKQAFLLQAEEQRILAPNLAFLRSEMEKAHAL